MNVYDTANRLGTEIKQSEEYLAYKKAKEKVLGNPDTKKKIDDFEKLRYDIQVLTFEGKENDPEKTKKLTDILWLMTYDQLLGEDYINQ